MSRFYGSLCIKNKILTTLHNNSAGQIKLERRAVVINYTLRMVTGTVLSSITLQQRQIKLHHSFVLEFKRIVSWHHTCRWTMDGMVDYCPSHRTASMALFSYSPRSSSLFLLFFLFSLYFQNSYLVRWTMQATGLCRAR